jgi:hypothetical protein
LRRPAPTIALAVAAALALWQAWWPVAALALAAIVLIGREGRVAVAVDAIVFLGLAGQADPLWVAALLAASWIAPRHDPRTLMVVLIASIAAIVLPLDWTVLCALLAILRLVPTARPLAARVRALIASARPTRARR